MPARTIENRPSGLAGALLVGVGDALLDAGATLDDGAVLDDDGAVSTSVVARSTPASSSGTAISAATQPMPGRRR